MRKFQNPVIIGTAIAFSVVSFNKPDPVKANPGILAPAAPLCVTGVGTVVCAVVGTVVLGGVTYYIIQQEGKNKVVDHQGNVKDLVIKTDENGREYVEVNSVEECNLVEPAIGRKVVSRQFKDGKVRCILGEEK